MRVKLNRWQGIVIKSKCPHGVVVGTVAEKIVIHGIDLSLSKVETYKTLGCFYISFGEGIVFGLTVFYTF